MEKKENITAKKYRRKLFWRIYPFVRPLEYDDSDQGACYDDDELNDEDDWEEWEDYSEW